MALGVASAGPAPTSGAGVDVSVPPIAYRDGPPPGYTGGFGEPTCRECHFDNPPAGETGGLGVRGFPGRAVPDSVYRVVVELTRPGMERAGFQLAVRWGQGPREGDAAGSLAPGSPRVQVVAGDSGAVRYAQHTLAGSAPGAKGRSAWILRWRTPEGCGPVRLHVAANAANGDDSEFGDHVYSLRLASEVTCEGEPAGAGPTSAGISGSRGWLR